MSATLDLNGGTHTIAADTTETYFAVTDASSGHNGTLVLEAGATLKFDDAPGAGFLAAGNAITVTIQGTSAAPCSIRSADDFPHNAWTMPGQGTTISAARCRFKGYSGAIAAAGWAFNLCDFGEDLYCSVDDVRAITQAPATGLISVSSALIDRFIRDAMDEIDDATGRRWNDNTVVDEVYDWDGRSVLRLNHYPVISIQAVSFRNGASTYELQTAGPEEDYYSGPEDLELGFVQLLSPPSYQNQALKASYHYGEAAVPTRVRKLAAKMAAISTYRVMQGAGHKDIYGAKIEALEKEIAKGLDALGTNLRAYVTPPAYPIGRRAWP